MPLTLVTGATGGLGEPACDALAAAGHDLILAVRDVHKGRALATRLGRRHPGRLVEVVPVDVCAPASVRAMADAVIASHARLDGLVLATAAFTATRQVTADGHERMWSTNVLAYHRVTTALLPLLRASPPARIVVVASTFAGGLDLDDPELTQGRFDATAQYRHTKQANRMWARALARSLMEDDIAVVSVGPGMAWTGLYADVHGFTRWILKGVSAVFGTTPDKAADVISWAMLAPALAEASGTFVVGRKVAPCAFQDASAEARLWDLLVATTEAAPGLRPPA